MNVYFVARNYIKEECWKYLIDVLKVDTVFSFIDVNDMSESLRNQFGKKIVRYNRFLPNGGDVSAFIKKCVKFIIGGAARFHLVDGKSAYEDLDGFADSHYDSPDGNLRDTKDKNVMIIADMYIKRISDRFSIPIFHEVTRVLTYERDLDTYSNYHVDASMEIVFYVNNLLMKVLGTDKYRDRICFFRFGRNDEQIFMQTKWVRATVETQVQDYLVGIRAFYRYVLEELNKQYPVKFPEREKNDKRYFTSFYDMDVINEELADEEREYEEKYREDDYDPYMGYGSYERMALLEAYEGDPSNMWNTD